MTPTSFAETLEKKLMERANYNKDLIEEKNRIQGELLSAPGMLRNELRSTAIRDPLARESILGDRLGNIRSGLGTVTDLLNMRGQRYSDIINRASGQYADEYAASQARGSGGGGFDMSAIMDYLNQGRESGGGGLAGGSGRTPIDPKEQRYNAFVNAGMSDAEAFQYAQNGVPQDTPRISEQGGFKGLLGRFIAPTLNQWQKMLGYQGPKRY